MTSPGHPVPPGWYPDPAGVLRWWDGAAWGPSAPPQQSALDSPALPVLAQVGMLFGLAVIAPLIAWLIVRLRTPLARAQTAEALNFQLLLTVLSMPAAAIYSGFWGWMTFGMDPMSRPGPVEPAPGWVLAAIATVLLTGVLWLIGTVLGIVAAVKVGGGRYWRYPVNLRLIDRTFLTRFARDWRATENASTISDGGAAGSVLG